MSFKLNIKRTIQAAILVAAYLTAQLANAWGIVFDPTNFTQTTITAIQSVEAEVTRLKQLEVQIKENLNSFGGKDIADLKREYGKVMSVYDSAKTLQSSIMGVSQNFDDVKSLFGSGQSKSFSEFGQDMARRSRMGDAAAKNMYMNSQNAQATMKSAYENHQKLVDQASAVNGVTEAAQSTTAAVGILIQQNNALLAMVSADQTKKALETSAATQKQKQDDQFGIDYKKRIAAESAALNSKYVKDGK